MPYYLFTFRPQVTEQDLFENFITILKPELDKLDKYAYSIEEDNTLQKHIHVIAEHPSAKDNSAFKQMFNKKIFKDFKSSLRTKQTNDKGFDDRKVTEAPEDFLKTLGYVLKESACIRRQTKGFTNEELLQAIEYYYTSKHIDKQSKINDDWTILTTKNAHILVEDYIIKNEIIMSQQYDISSTIKIRMIKDKYSFINLSNDKQRQLFNEILIAHKDTSDKQRSEKISEETFPSYGYVARLEQLLHNNNIEY